MIRFDLTCSKCGGKLGPTDFSNCPHCGADLIKPRQEEFRRMAKATGKRLRWMIKEEEKNRKGKGSNIPFGGSLVYMTVP